jgi:cytochrome c556
MSPRLPISLAILMCVGSMGSGYASSTHELSPAAAVEARQSGFKKMGAALKAITEQLKTGSPDTSTLTASTQTLISLAEKVPHWFPAGSGAETDALPNVWTDRARFDALAQDLVADVKSLSATIAANDMEAVRAQAKRTGATCSACHRSFRAD